jgi:uncharacterized protein (TIGR00730 family)
MKAVCVFCGSNSGQGLAYTAAAEATGKALAERGLVTVYGGGRRGLMGTVADAALAAGGQVHGVITEYLVGKELQHPRLTRTEVVKSMAERKDKLEALSDAFITLPGGVGTLEELFDMWSRIQLAGMKKPLGVLNVAGFYDDLDTFMHKLVRTGFVAEGHLTPFVVETDVTRLIDKLAAFEFADSSKWL